MDETTQLYKDLSLILTTLGKVQPHEVDRKASLYDDPKLIILGLWANDDSGTQLKYEAIWAALKTADTSAPPLDYPMFGADTTLVFEANCGATLYERDGHWKAYVDNFVVAIKRDRKRRERSNGEWIDDTRLFPDLD